MNTSNQNTLNKAHILRSRRGKRNIVINAAGIDFQGFASTGTNPGDTASTDFINFNESQKLFTKSSFDYLLREIFKKFNNPQNPKYIARKWLVDQFTRILDSNDRDQNIYDNLYGLLLLFYFHNPFDFETKATSVFYNFFIAHDDFKVEISQKEKVFEDYTEDPQNAIKKHFIENKKFQSYLINNFTKVNTFRSIVSSILWDEIDKFLKSKDPDYTKNNNSTLYNWVANKFSYDKAKRIGLSKSYDFYFKGSKTNREILNASKTDFETKFTNEVATSLSSSSENIPPLTQVVYYYLLIDIINRQFIIPIEKGNYKDAEKLVDSYYANLNSNSLPIDLVNNLNIFLLHVKQQITKFGFNWKTNNKAYGLIFEKDEPSEFLTPRDVTRSIYDFRFKFKFITNYIEDPIAVSNEEVFKFNIPVEVRISDFEKAVNIINKFINKDISWSRGYMDQPLWTEKDIVDWIEDFSTVEDFRKFITPIKGSQPTFEKRISLNDWLRFSSTNLGDINFSLIDSPDYIFKVIPIIIFDVDPKEFQEEATSAEETTPNYFGQVRMSLRLYQLPKNYKEGDLPIKQVDFEVKSSSEVLTMLKLVNNKIREKFSNFLTFTKWKEEGNSFWLNEFIDNKGNSISRLNSEDIFKQRSNIFLLKSFAETLKERINNEYRDDFKINLKLLVEDNDDGKKGKKITLGFTFLDSLLQKKKQYEKSLYTSKMKVFSEIKNGEFKDTKGSDILLKQKYAEATPLPTVNQKKPEIGEPLPDDFTFIINNKRVKFIDIINSFRQEGFKDTSISNVKWELEDGSPEFINYVDYTYHVDYFDFSTNQVKKYSNKIKIYINFDGVTPKQIEEGYQNVVKGIPEDKKNDKKLLKKINAVFSQLKKSGTNEWRDDVSLTEYKKVIQEAIDLIAEFRPNDDIIKQIESIYNNKVPPKILNKLSDPKYLNTVREILKKHKTDFSLSDLKKILENDSLMKFYENQQESRIKDSIMETLKLTKYAKYSYFGVGVGLGVFGLLAGSTSLGVMRLNSKTKTVSTKYKKSRYISMLSLGASILSFVGSAALMLIFFIEKGGF